MESIGNELLADIGLSFPKVLNNKLKTISKFHGNSKKKFNYSTYCQIFHFEQSFG